MFKQNHKEAVLNENLNFLCGSGTSASIGGRTINKGVNPFDSIITELKTISTPKEHITQLIKYFESIFYWKRNSTKSIRNICTI